MIRPTRFCRVAWTVDDMDKAVADLARLLGLSMRFGDVAKDILIAGIDEHGLEPIQLLKPNLPFMADVAPPLVEVALAVDDAEASKALLARDGIEPFTVSYLPVPDTNEYLYGASVFHGIPVMVCTDGDNEAQMAPFRDLEAAPAPKVGCVVIAVDKIEKAAADFTKYFGMTFAETDAGGLGARAVVGPHRVKLVESPDASLQGQFMPPLLAAEMLFDNVEAIHDRLATAGFKVLRERTFKSGRKAYYFGTAPIGLPLTILSSADDAENRGLV